MTGPAAAAAELSAFVEGRLSQADGEVCFRETLETVAELVVALQATLDTPALQGAA